MKRMGESTCSRRAYKSLKDVSCKPDSLKILEFTSLQPRTFQGSQSFLELGDFDKRFNYNTPKKGSTVKYSRAFFLDALKTKFQMRHLTHGWTQSGYVFLKSGNFVLIF